MAKKRLRTDRVIVSFLLLVIICIFPADSVRRIICRYNGSYGSENAVVIRQEGSIIQNITGNEDDSPDTENKKTVFAVLEIYPSQLGVGELVKVDNINPYTGTGHEDTATVDLVSYRNDYYTLINETDSVILNINAADALNMMMKDYYEATGQTNFLVYGTTDTYTGEGSYCPQFFPESVTGNTIDLAVNVGNSVLTYDGCDQEKWIIENCHKYGYILRFPAKKSEITGNEFCPWHLRYVGRVHAAAMKELDYCFEEYLEFLSNYTFDRPLPYNLDGEMYYIYSVKYAGEITTTYVSPSEDYTVSGNNTDSFIITSEKF